MFLTALFIISLNWKQFKCPSLRQQITCNIFIQWGQEGFKTKWNTPPVKRNKFLLHTTWTTFNNIIILNKIRQTQNSTYSTMPFMQSSRTANLIYSEGSKNSRGQRRQEVIQGSFWSDGTISQLNKGVDYTGICICQNLSNCILKIYGFHWYVNFVSIKTK